MKRNHAKLICDVGELTGLFSHAQSLETFLQQIVEMIANHMQAEVCSIYLFNDDSQELTLTATKGLNAAAVNNVRMRIGEGLTGRALKEMRAIYAKDVSEDSSYKFFPDIGEEKYRSFLAVPIVRGQVRIGVIVTQSHHKGYFTEDDIYAFRAVTSQLANTIETTRLLMNIEYSDDQEGEQVDLVEDLKVVKVRVGVEGWASGPVTVFSQQNNNLFDQPFQSDKSYSKDELLQAMIATEKQLEESQFQIEKKLFDVASLIFTAQILMLKDKPFIDAIMRLVDEGINPPEAVRQIASLYVGRFNKIDNPYVREKAHDVMDVCKRVLENLTGTSTILANTRNHIIITHELLPSEALKLYSQKVKGIILLAGGVTSHLTILCRSLNIPLVIADDRFLERLPQDTSVLINGEEGRVYINPEQNLIDRAEQLAHERTEALKHVEDIDDKTLTRDNHKINLLANINLLADVQTAQMMKAEGVGLYRTEFPFMVRNSFPSEEEQFVIYRRLVEQMDGKDVTFRTLDIGGDKILSYYTFAEEENPFLGLRSIRFSLQNKDIFKQQIKAILRAGHDTKSLKLMFPMISSVDEFLEAKEVVEDCINNLKEERAHYAQQLKIGIMVELPSAVEVIDELAKHADFFSIGTNDLVQYMLAVDRTNQKVADLYLPHHPAVLSALNKVMIAAKRHRRDVTICGDMAQNIKYIPFLIGIGIHQLSMDARYIPKVQQFLQKTSLKQSRKFAKKLLQQKTVSDVVIILNQSDKFLNA